MKSGDGLLSLGINRACDGIHHALVPLISFDPFRLLFNPSFCRRSNTLIALFVHSLADSYMDIEEKSAPRIRFGDQRLPDEEDGYVAFERRQREPSRRGSIGSLSIHSTGGTRTVQPETALPITYRTLSIEIDEEQHQKQKDVKKAKEKAAVGTLTWLLTALVPAI